MNRIKRGQELLTQSQGISLDELERVSRLETEIHSNNFEAGLRVPGSGAARAAEEI